jgi:hypothetical protein
MEGGLKRHRSRRKKQEKAEDLGMEKKGKRTSLSVKIKNHSTLLRTGYSSDLKSEDQNNLEKEEFVIDRQTDKEERQKLTYMWSGVIFFMVIIVIGWVVTFRQSFGIAKTDGQSLLDWQKWNQTADDIGKNFETTAGQLQTMKSLLTQAAAQNASGTSATAAPLNQTELNNMKTKILELQIEKTVTNK